MSFEEIRKNIDNNDGKLFVVTGGVFAPGYNDGYFTGGRCLPLVYHHKPPLITLKEVFREAVS